MTGDKLKKIFDTPASLLELESQCPERLERLLKKDRAQVEKVALHSSVYHRYVKIHIKNPLIERQLHPIVKISVPKQSITIGDVDSFEYDQYDALLEIDQSLDESAFKRVLPNRAVVEWENSFLEGWSYTPPVEGKRRSSTWSIGVDHVPYERNYAHGILTIYKNGAPDTLSVGAKKNLRSYLLAPISHNLNPNELTRDERGCVCCGGFEPVKEEEA